MAVWNQEDQKSLAGMESQKDLEKNRSTFSGRPTRRPNSEQRRKAFILCSISTIVCTILTKPKST